MVWEDVRKTSYLNLNLDIVICRDYIAYYVSAVLSYLFGGCSLLLSISWLNGCSSWICWLWFICMFCYDVFESIFSTGLSVFAVKNRFTIFAIYVSSRVVAIISHSHWTATREISSALILYKYFWCCPHFLQRSSIVHYCGFCIVNVTHNFNIPGLKLVAVYVNFLSGKKKKPYCSERNDKLPNITIA